MRTPHILRIEKEVILLSNLVDLHIHTTASDGTTSPREVIKKAIKKGLKYISITDHESINAYDEIFSDHFDENEINIIPGIELHAFYKGKEIHLLGYNIDLKEETFRSKLKIIRKERTDIAKEMVQMLKNKGMKISWDSFIEIEKRDVAVTKAHIIGYIRENYGIDRNLFYDYFHPQGRFYIAYKGNPFESAVKMIRKMDGIAVLAHPGLIGDDAYVEEILDQFKVGLEVYYHYFGNQSPLWVEKYKKMSQDKKCLFTGGSDYHGTITPVEIGDTYVPMEAVFNLNCKT